MEPKIESNVLYDDRKKELTHINRETREAEIEGDTIGMVSLETRGIYSEKGIRRIVTDLAIKQVNLDKVIKNLKTSTNKTKKLASDKELLNLQNLLKNLQKLDAHQKQVIQLEDAEKDLKRVNKDLKEIKKTIGTRLRF